MVHAKAVAQCERAAFAEFCGMCLIAAGMIVLIVF